VKDIEALATRWPSEQRPLFRKKNLLKLGCKQLSGSAQRLVTVHESAGTESGQSCSNQGVQEKKSKEA